LPLEVKAIHLRNARKALEKGDEWQNLWHNQDLL
jgi:hypothetical protein